MVIKTKKRNASRYKHTNNKNNKNNKYTTKKPYKINVYAKNMRYINNNELNPKYNNENPIDINKDKYKILLSKLSEALGENQWLKYSKNKYKPIQHINQNNINTKKNYYIGSKPQGSYYSKGGWLFHQLNCCELDKELIFIEVDYKTIYRITGKDPYKSPLTNKVYKNIFLEFMNTYGVDFVKDTCMLEGLCWDYDTKEECNQTKTACHWDTTKYNEYTKINGVCVKKKLKIDPCNKIKNEAKCKNNKAFDCYFENKYKLINWAKLYKNYYGFAIYPYPELKMMTSKKTRENFQIFMDYEVETLVLWDHTPVIKYHNLGTIRNIIEETGIKLKKNEEFINYYKEFIETLIKKINVINKQ